MNKKEVKLVCTAMIFIVMATLVFTGFNISDTGAIAEAWVSPEVINGIDYTGQTKFRGETYKKKSEVNGDTVKVPVKGAYDVKFGDVWLAHSYSNWSIYNNRASTETVEYKVDSREEYKYYKDKKVANYQTKYYTKYKGTKWNNKFITKTESNWYGYPGEIANYRIIEHYTKQVRNGTKTEREYKDWTPTNHYTWTRYDTRITYRYKSRNLVWDKNKKTMQEMPLRYSLKYASGAPIGYGLKWDFNYDISNQTQYNVAYLDCLMYFISSDTLAQIIQNKLTEIRTSLENNNYSEEEILRMIASTTDFTDEQTEPISQLIGMALNSATLGISLLAQENVNRDTINDIKSYEALISEIRKTNATLVIHYKIDIPSAYSNAYTNGSEDRTDNSMLEIIKSDCATVSMKYTDNPMKEDLLKYIVGSGTQNCYGAISTIYDLEEVTKVIADYHAQERLRVAQMYE